MYGMCGRPHVTSCRYIYAHESALTAGTAGKWHPLIGINPNRPTALCASARGCKHFRAEPPTNAGQSAIQNKHTHTHPKKRGKRVTPTLSARNNLLASANRADHQHDHHRHPVVYTMRTHTHTLDLCIKLVNWCRFLRSFCVCLCCPSVCCFRNKIISIFKYMRICGRAAAYAGAGHILRGTRFAVRSACRAVA